MEPCCTSPARERRRGSARTISTACDSGSRPRSELRPATNKRGLDFAYALDYRVRARRETAMRHRAAFVVLAALTLTSNVEAASLEKARSLRQSGLQAEARKELAEIVSSEAVARADRAEALLLLGEMDVDEKGFDAARQHWQTVVASYPETKAASSAK